MSTKKTILWTLALVLALLLGGNTSAQEEENPYRFSTGVAPSDSQFVTPSVGQSKGYGASFQLEYDDPEEGWVDVYTPDSLKGQIFQLFNGQVIDTSGLQTISNNGSVSKTFNFAQAGVYAICSYGEASEDGYAFKDGNCVTLHVGVSVPAGDQIIYFYSVPEVNTSLKALAAYAHTGTIQTGPPRYYCGDTYYPWSSAAGGDNPCAPSYDTYGSCQDALEIGYPFSPDWGYCSSVGTYGPMEIKFQGKTTPYTSISHHPTANSPSYFSNVNNCNNYANGYAQYGAYAGCMDTVGLVAIGSPGWGMPSGAKALLGCGYSSYLYPANCYPGSTGAWNNEPNARTVVVYYSGPAGVSVTSNLPSATWAVNPGNKTGTGNASVVVSPSGGGTLYTITPANVSGYQYPPTVTNSKAPTGASVLLYPDEAVSFALTYTVQPPFDFSLTNGGAKSVVQGASVTQSVNANLTSGNTSSVAYSVSGLPSGVTHNFSPTSCSPNCSTTMNITAGASTPAGSYNVTVTGTGGGVTRTTAFTLTVTASFDFSLTSGGARTIVQGGSVDQGFTSNLVSGATTPTSFTASGFPSGVTHSFSVSSCSPTCSPTLSMTAGASVTPGSYTITITGTGGGLTRTTAFTLTVSTSAADLTASAPPQTSATAGSPTSFTSVISNNGNSSTGASFYNVFQVATAANGGGTVTNLSAVAMSSLASGASNTATSPSYTFPSGGTYSVRACADKSSGSDPGTISETNESNNCGGWTNVTVGAAFDFFVSSGGNISVVQGNSVTQTITATLSAGATTGVSFSASGFPSGVTTSSGFVPASCSPTCNISLPISVGASVAPGSYTITIVGTGGGVSRSTTFTFTVIESFNFSLSNGGDKLVTQGSNVSQTVTATLSAGATASVSYSISGLPSGATHSFLPTSCTPTCTTTLTIDTANSTPLGNSTITITATGGGLTRTTSFTLTVVAPAGAVINVVNNTSGSWTIQPGNHIRSGSASVNVSPVVGGTAYTINGDPVTGYDHPPTYTNSDGAGPGMVVFPGTTKQFTLNYTLTPIPFDYSLSHSPSGSLTIQKSETDSIYDSKLITKTLVSGTTEAVNILDLSGVPSGVTYEIAARNCSPTCDSNIIFNVSPAATVGTHQITVTGSPLNKTTQFDLIIQAAPPPPPGALSVTCEALPAIAAIGQEVLWTATPSGGTPPFTYSWSGSAISPSSPPTTASFTKTYSTTGLKVAVASVIDSGSQSASCYEAESTVLIIFNPIFKEI